MSIARSRGPQRELLYASYDVHHCLRPVPNTAADNLLIIAIGAARLFGSCAPKDAARLGIRALEIIRDTMREALAAKDDG